MITINDAQLQVWATPPGGTAFEDTYASVKHAIESDEKLKGKSIEIYLQGSYRNHTNIRSESDVDIVVQLNDTFGSDKSRLTPQQLTLHDAAYSDATYLHSHFRDDVKAALERYYTSQAIKMGEKSIKVTGNGRRLHADVIPSIQFREYTYFNSTGDHEFFPGIKFYTLTGGKRIINYPKIHISLGEAKNHADRTDGKYKDLVRIMKNLSVAMVDDRVIPEGTAPSYFVESAVYNVPDTLLKGNHMSNLQNAITYLYEGAFDAKNAKAINGRHDLFGDEEWEWNLQDANVFLLGARRLVNGS